MTPSDQIVSTIADRESRKLARRVIRHLQRMAPCGHSDLENAWNELCVQVQGQESIFWNSYEDSAMQLISRYAAKMDLPARQTIWLQTQIGSKWQPGENDKDVPSFEDDIAEYILHDYVLPAAGDWTNKRIRKHNGHE